MTVTAGAGDLQPAWFCTGRTRQKDQLLFPRGDCKVSINYGGHSLIIVLLIMSDCIRSFT